MAKKRKAICVLMKYQKLLYTAIWENAAGELPSLKQLEAFTENHAHEGLKAMINDYSHQIDFRLVLHFDQYCSLLIQDKGLKNTNLKKSLRYLLAEQSYFETYNDWLIHFSSQRKGYVHVLTASPEKIEEDMHSFGLSIEQFSSIDSYDYALANAILFSEPNEQPIVLMIHNQGIVRCLLLENHRLCFLQETSILEENAQDKTQQLIQRLSHYFSLYHNRPLLFIGFDPTLPLTSLPYSWQFKLWDGKTLNFFSKKVDNPIYLPLIGMGLRYASQFT